MEKPKIKRKVFINKLFLVNFKEVLVSKSLNDKPVIKTRYVGTRGKKQGVKKVKTPAVKATKIDTFSIKLNLYFYAICYNKL